MPRPSDPNGTPEPQLQLPLVAKQSSEQRVFAMMSEPELREWVTGLWVRYQGLLLELANYHLRDRDRAQEVVQDIWVDFMKSLGRFEGRCSPKTWLVQILRRRLKKELRRMIFRRTHEAVLGIGEARRYDDLGAREADSRIWRGNPEQSLLVQERLEYVLRVSRTLPGRQAEVWMLRDVLQWTSEEASTALTITQENQRILLHRARQRLKLEIERYFGQTPKGAISLR
jgi:RNA polymerase sigma-70 factor, ECF subfamily